MYITYLPGLESESLVTVYRICPFTSSDLPSISSPSPTKLCSRCACFPTWNSLKTKGFLIIPFCSLRGIPTGAFSPWAWPWISPSPVTFQSPPHFPVNLEHFQLFICSLPHSLCVISMICFLTLYFPSQNTTFFFVLPWNFPPALPVLPLNLNHLQISS